MHGAGNGTLLVFVRLPDVEEDAAAEALLRGTGAFLIAYAALVWVTGTRRTIPRAPVLAIIAGNAAWAAGSVVAAIAGLGDPSTAGTVWMVLQAGVVAGFAELQLTGLRRRDG